MNTLDETLTLLKRQAELEATMLSPGTIRVAEERELLTLRNRLSHFPEATRAILQAAHGLRRPIAEMTVGDVESWASLTERA